MNNKVLKTLEYDKIIEMLAAKASCDAGAAKCRKLLPYNNLNTIEQLQKETASAFTRLVRWGDQSFSGTYDMRPYLSRLAIGSCLSIPELLAVASLLEVTKRVCVYGAQQDDSRDELSIYFENLHSQPALLTEIRRCIIDEDTIADDASSALASIRRGMQSTHNRIKEELSKMLNNSTTRGYLQEAVITQRDGRYCLPVRNDYKSHVPGMVHDQSSSGSTFFIEPMSVVNLNNELRELQIREKDEIERILANLSNSVAEVSESIKGNYDILVQLDFIFAKGRLAVDMNACSPLFNTDGIINLKQARHPLLAKDKVVPVDLKLGEDYNLLLITGPNTGGKTVSLKTCGLLTLMAQSGLHIPVKDRSQIAIFDDIYADIGDEQSIEQSLSTFSSHMTNIVNILDSISSGTYSHDTDNAREDHLMPFEPTRIIAKNNDSYVPQFLVLLDELCAGTDPKEGAALAQAILDRLHNLDVRIMATTHYSELKVYALTTEGVENASCEFSLETLSPTYRLMIGVPGKSNAFAISGKLGLPNDLIDIAKTHLSENDKSFEDLMVDLEQRRHQIEEDQIAISADRALAAKKLAEVEAKQQKLNDNRDRIIREANEKASNILQHAKDVADATIRDFNKYAKGSADIQKMEQKRQNIGKELSGARNRSVEKIKPSENKNAPTEVRIGDKVKVVSMNLTGNVCSLPNAKGDLTVQMGIMKTNVNIKDLVLVQEENPYAPKKGSAKKAGSGYGGLSKTASISTEINLLGCTVDEAIARLDKYLDDAYISHLKSVRVVHGKGTGALRSGVQQYLRKNRVVASFHQAEFGEGDAGVTIVEFKE